MRTSKRSTRSARISAGAALCVSAALIASSSGQASHPDFEIRLWAPAQQITFSPKPSSLQFNWGWAIDIDGAGVVHLTWLERESANGPGQVLYSRSGDDGVGWTAPVSLSPVDAGPPKLAAAGPYVYVAWHSVPEGRVFLRRSADHGGHWDPGTLLSNQGSFPSVNAWGGTAHVVWSSPDPQTGAPEIFIRSSPDGGVQWTPVTMVSERDGRSSWVPSVASWGPVIHVAWSDERHNIDLAGAPVDCRFGTEPCREEEYYRRSIDFGTSWDPEIRLTEDPTDEPKPSWAPSIAAWMERIHVSFFDARTGSFQVYQKRSRLNGEIGTWEPEVLLSNDPSPLVQRQRPSIAVHGEELNVVYFATGPSPNGPLNGVFSVTSVDGGSHFDLPQLLGFGLHPSVGASPRGTIHVAWTGPDATGLSQIFHRRRTKQPSLQSGLSRRADSLLSGSRR